MGEHHAGEGSAIADSKYSNAYRAKMKIVEACNNLCKTIPYEHVRVSDIVKEAGISRTGFYYHFQDKSAIVLWMSDQFYAEGLDEIGRTLTWFEGHLVTTHLFKKFNALFNSAANDREYRSGQSYYVRHRQKILTDTLVNYQEKQLTPLLKFQIEALPYSEMAMANKFMANEFDLTLKEYAKLAASLAPRELHDALDSPVSPSSQKNLILIEQFRP